jgi:hypothetical protein
MVSDHGQQSWKTPARIAAAALVQASGFLLEDFAGKQTTTEFGTPQSSPIEEGTPDG